MLNKNQIQRLRQNFTFWDQLSSQQQELIITNAQVAHYPSGSSLHVCEMECIGVLLLLSGVLRTYILSEEGREITLYRLAENEVCVLSASCVLRTITFDVQIDAQTDCEILQISSSAFAKIMSENIYAEAFTYKLATERFSDVMWTMQQILFKSLDRRLAAFLLDESVKNKSNTIQLTHDQIARYMGSVREVISRMLRYFVKEGYVTVSRGSIQIINKEKLRQLI